jgi:hypothetical protein
MRFKLEGLRVGVQDGRQDQVRWGYLPNDDPPAAACSTSASGKVLKKAEVRQCAAHYLMLPGRRRVVPPKLQDLDSCALLVQHGSSATHYSGSGSLACMRSLA